MAHVTIEYMILAPVLILQIFLFPYVAQVMTAHWEDSRLQLEVEEITGHLGSSVQQLYYTMNRQNISSGSLTVKLDTPPRIVDSAYNCSYTITVAHAAAYTKGEYAQIMNITVSLFATHASTLVTLGENADWEDASFSSDKVSVISAARSQDFIWLSFEED